MITIDSRIRVNLKGKVAVVTGAGQGIGRVIALFLADDGANIVVNDINPKTAEKVANEIRSLGSEALAVLADVSNWKQVENMVNKTLETFGKIDILVNNAGIVGPITPITKLQEADWDKVINVNLKGVFLCTKAVLPHMIKRGYGKIVNLSSIAGKEGNKNMAAYCASKAGIIGLTKAIAEEVAAYGIRVNCVTPALIEGTPLTLSMPPEQIKYLKSKIPLGRLGKPEDIADLIKFLVSDASNFITGQAWNICGGRGKY